MTPPQTKKQSNQNQETSLATQPIPGTKQKNMRIKQELLLCEMEITTDPPRGKGIW